MNKPKMNIWTEIGSVGVDAGLMMIGDPCYVTHPNPVNALINDWDKFCIHVGKKENQIHNNVVCEIPFVKGHSGAAVVTSTGIGDGRYGVFVKFIELEGWGIRIKEVKVVFIEDE